MKASQKLKDAPIASDSSSDDEVPSADIGQTTVPESSSNAEPPQKVVATSSQGVTLTVNEDATEEEVTQTIDEKIAAARSRLSPKHCLFCSNVLPSLEANLTHMSTAHSFFIPDADYLTDLEGLITYLGEKIAIGNVCLFCNTRSREFRTMDAVRKHMVDKSHCKIAYDSQNDRLEISDYYDFSSSYPDQARKSKSKSKSKKSTLKLPAGEDAEEWEDVDDDGEEADEVVDGVPSSEDEDDSDDDSDDEDASDSDESLSEEELTYGDTPYELVLPSGARIGHRTMKRYYQQSFPKSALVLKDGSEDANSGAALVRRLLADKNSALIPRKGGFGAYGIGTEVVKARNRGEAREAGRHVREFRDQKRREDFKTRVGFISNHQKHFRDPLLQVRIIYLIMIFIYNTDICLALSVIPFLLVILYDTYSIISVTLANE